METDKQEREMQFNKFVLELVSQEGYKTIAKLERASINLNGVKLR